MIKLVLAVDEAGGIGKDNTMPWPHCSADLKRFKALTTGHVVVMGSRALQYEYSTRTDDYSIFLVVNK